MKMKTLKVWVYLCELESFPEWKDLCDENPELRHWLHVMKCIHIGLVLQLSKLGFPGDQYILLNMQKLKDAFVVFLATVQRVNWCI